MSAKRRNFRITFTAAAILLTVLAFFLISVLGNLRGARIDMTSDQLFTMTPAAKDILQGLKVPVEVKLYITPPEKMPTQYRNLERDITEQLRNFESVAKGKLRFQVFNPQDDEALQQTLVAKGIQPFQVQSVEKDEIGVKLIWSAMTIAYMDKPEEILPRLLPQSLAALEQDIIGPVYRLTREKTPKVAVVAPKKPVDQQLAMMYMQQGMQPPEPQDRFTRIAELLTNYHYEVVPVELTEAAPIPDDTDLLIVMAMTQLNDRQIFEINRALRGGLPVIMGVQAHEYGYNPARNGGWSITGQNIDTGLEAMLGEFGMTVSQDHFCDMSHETIEVPREINLGGMRMQTREAVRLPVQISVAETQMLQESLLVNRIGQLFYIWGTPVLSNPDQLAAHGLQATNLVVSSPNCWREPFTDGPVLPAVFDDRSKQKLGAQPLAVLLEGIFPDTFAGMMPPEWPAAATPPDAEDPNANAGPTPVAEITPNASQLFLVGNAMMFDDNMLGAAQNQLLLVNAVDYLAGSRELLTIRSKILTQRIIRPTEAGEKMIWRIFVVLLIPVMIAVYGILRAGVRRKEAARYRQDLKRSAGHGLH